jgi:hypothetical protein
LVSFARSVDDPPARRRAPRSSSAIFSPVVAGAAAGLVVSPSFSQVLNPSIENSVVARMPSQPF